MLITTGINLAENVQVIFNLKVFNNKHTQQDGKLNMHRYIDLCYSHRSKTSQSDMQGNFFFFFNGDTPILKALAYGILEEN